MSVNDNQICKTVLIHEDIVNKVRPLLTASEILSPLSEFFRILGDPTRLKILQALHVSEMCVCDLAFLMKMSQSAISHQLRVLRQANLVKYRKEGKIVYYSLHDNHIKSMMDFGLEHINEKQIIR